MFRRFAAVARRRRAEAVPVSSDGPDRGARARLGPACRARRAPPRTSASPQRSQPVRRYLVRPARVDASGPAPPPSSPDAADLRPLINAIVNRERTSFVWDHLIYAYMIENTRICEIFRRVVHEFTHGEKLGTPRVSRRCTGCGIPRSCSIATRRRSSSRRFTAPSALTPKPPGARPISACSGWI